mmetsp:Transcript_60168/g.105408  ORF Transcript_60168/g.105408 Transcript_60168/m.105408 type:complete len:444 (+) Transcript_60168:91-1422(+)
MALRSIYKAIALIITIVAVFLSSPSLQPPGNEPATGESISLQLEDRLDESSSLMQVSDTINHRSHGKQIRHQAGAASEPAAKKTGTPQSSATSPVTKDNLAVLQLGLRRLRDRAMGVTILVFVLCGVALIVILFRLYSDSSSRDDRMYRRGGGRSAESYLQQRDEMYSQPPQRKDPYNYAPEPRGSTQMMPSSSPAQDAFMTGRFPPSSSAQLPGAQPMNQPPPGRPASPMSESKMSSPDLGAIVPAKRKFIVKLPSLLENFPPDTETSKNYPVNTQDNIEMFNLKVLRLHSEEYLALCMPTDTEKELAVCTFYLEGNVVACEIYKSASVGGNKLFGFLQEEPVEPRIVTGVPCETYSLWSASPPSSKLLTIRVVGNAHDRKIKIFDGRNPTVEVASTIPASASDALYETECYPHSDVTLVIIALAAVDRIVALSTEMSRQTT